MDGIGSLSRYVHEKVRCSEDSTIIKDYIEQDRVFGFLVGLNLEYDQVRIQILGKVKVPRLNEVIVIIQSEEGKRNLMLETSIPESTTMVVEERTTMIVNQKGSRQSSYMEKKHKELWCTYCHMPHHTEEKC